MAGSTNELASLIQRLEAVAIKLENAQGGSGAASEIKKHLSSLKASPSSALATLQKTVEDLELSLGANGGGTSMQQRQKRLNLLNNTCKACQIKRSDTN